MAAPASAPVAGPLHVDLTDTFGAAYIGAMVTMVMYGITTLQTYFYFVTYPEDSRDLKALAMLIWVLDTLHITLVGQAMYHYLISNFGIPSALATGTWELYVSIGLNVGIALVVQLFFIKRIWRLCGFRSRWWVVPVLILTTLAHFAFGVVSVAKLYRLQEFSKLHTILLDAAMPFAITAVLSDVFIATALCVLLWNSRSEFKDTNNIISRLMVWAINRCLLTSVVAVAEVVVFAVRPNDFWFFAIDFVIGKLYANSLLASLNARRSLKGRGTDDEEAGTSAGTSTGFEFATNSRAAESVLTRGMIRSHAAASSVAEAEAQAELFEMERKTLVRTETEK